MALSKPLPGPALPPPQRSPYHHGDLPSALKQAAVALIARHGVQGFSLREAATAVGVSPSAAYRHYADKAALLGAVAGDALADESTWQVADFLREQARRRLSAPQ